MKILSFEEFIRLPAGTIYSDYDNGACRGLNRKGRTIFHDDEPRDFFTASVMAEYDMQADKPVVDDIEGRWGVYVYTNQYAVYEEEDLKVMRAMLSGATLGPVEWQASDITDAEFMGTLEFEVGGEFRHFEVLLLRGDRYVFGGATNSGFLESGYMKLEEEGNQLEILREELETYYRDGPRYVTRIVCNDRM